MGLMDKMKAQANQLAQKTQEAAQEGKAKLDQAQANRRGDVLLRQLGAAVYAERTARGTPETQAKIEELIGAISAHERENGLNLAPSQTTVPQPGAPADPSNPSPGPAGSQYPPSGGASDAGMPFPPPGGGQDAGVSFPPPGQSFFPPPGDGEPGGSSGFPPSS
jgi:hypothetical protein